MKKFLQTFCASTLLVTMIPMMTAEAAAKDDENVNYEQKEKTYTTYNWSTYNFNKNNWLVDLPKLQKEKNESEDKLKNQPDVSTTENKEQTTTQNQQTVKQTTSSNNNTSNQQSTSTDNSTQTAASNSSSNTDNQIDAIEAKVVELTNAERAKKGLSPLQIDTQLMAAAREKSEDMKANQYFSHTSPTFGSPFDRLKALGISYQAAGENIAKGQKTAEEVVEAWMNSEGHRANILDANFTHIGVGYVQDGSIWTQQFIKK